MTARGALPRNAVSKLFIERKLLLNKFIVPSARLARQDLIDNFIANKIDIIGDLFVRYCFIPYGSTN